MENKELKKRINNLTKMVAGKMSKSNNYENVDYVQLEEVLKIIDDIEEESKAKK